MSDQEKKAREYLKKREERLSQKTGTIFQYSGYEENLIIQSYISGMEAK